MLFRKNKQKKKRSKSETSHRHLSKLQFTRNIRISSKYLFAFSISIILFVSATVIVFLQLTAAKDDIDHIVQRNEVKSDLVQLALFIEQQGSIVTDYLLINDPGLIDEFKKIDENVVATTEQLANKLSESEAKQFERVIQGSEFIRTTFLDEIAIGDISEANEIYAPIQVNTNKKTSVSYLNVLLKEIEKQEKKAINQVNASMDHSNNILILANIVSIVTGLIIMIFITRIISRHLKKVINVATEIAAGNLSVEQINYKGKDEIGKLSNAMNTLSRNMRNTINEVTAASNAVTGKSDILKQSSLEVNEGSEQMVITMDELATGAETQANHSSQLSEQMTEFVELIQQSQQQGEQIVHSTNDILQVTEDGATLMEQSIYQMKNIDSIVSKAVKQVLDLDDQSEEITTLIEVVKSIADQTNLLALNAAIEAARAGEHGKGFAVVADEVRKLAEQVTSSVTEITKIVQHIQQETRIVANSLDNGYEEVVNGITQIEQTGKSFVTIESSITEMVNDINSIADRLQLIARNSESMNKSIEDIAAVSEETAAGVEQSSASTQESSSAMDEVSNSADELAQLAEGLRSNIAVFKL